MHITITDNSGIVTTLEVSPTDSVLDIKKHIKDVKGIELNDQTLLFSGGVLEPSHFISQYDIVDDSVIHLVTPLPCSERPDDDFSEVMVHVRTPDGNIRVFAIDEEEKFELLKEMIEDEFGIPVGKQLLLFRRELLKDN